VIDFADPGEQRPLSAGIRQHTGAEEGLAARTRRTSTRFGRCLSRKPRTGRRRVGPRQGLKRTNSTNTSQTAITPLGDGFRYRAQSSNAYGRCLLRVWGLADCRATTRPGSTTRHPETTGGVHPRERP
jgi:hypothetical protein